MKIDASARAALRKRKQQIRNASVLHVEELDEIRAATRSKLQELLTVGSDSDESELAASIAEEIEEQLYEDNKTVNANYRAGFRRLFTSLKDQRADFAARLMSREISGREFASKPVDQLKSKDQQATESRIKKENIDKSIGQTLLPESIQQVNDGRDREKWGVTRSAAALDD